MDIDRIREFVDLMKELDIAELQIEQHGVNMRIRRPEQHVMAAAGAVLPAAPTASPEAAGGDAGGTGAADHAGAHMVRSPMVGTLYLSPEPGADAFAQVGDKIEEGQTLCIVEAMKLMNEITADVAGELVAVLHENGQPVEYGQKLFAVRPD